LQQKELNTTILLDTGACTPQDNMEDECFDEIPAFVDHNYSRRSGVVVEEDEDAEPPDVIVKEIDVYLSPHLFVTPSTSSSSSTSSTTTTTYRSGNPQRTYLMQYPGHWNHQYQHPHQQYHHPNENDRITTTAMDEDTEEVQDPLHAALAPVSIQIKPRHNIMEEEHVVVGMSDGNSSTYNNSTDDGDNTKNDPSKTTTTTTTRTYESQTIPMNTHLCFGKLCTTKATTSSSYDNNSNNKNNKTELHLIPISHITQMRPSFQHLVHLLGTGAGAGDNDAYPNNNDDDNNDDDNNDKATTTATTTTITYQRKESDRAIAARKSSYAYQRESQDREAFISLQVLHQSTNNTNVVVHENHDHDLQATDDTMHPQQQQSVSSSSSSSSAAYVQSLNYLSPSQHDTTSMKSNQVAPATTTVRNNTLQQQQQQQQDRVVDAIQQQKRYVHRIVSTLQQIGGPIPFSILLLSLNDHDSTGSSSSTVHRPSSNTVQKEREQMLISILNSVAVLVRGNWFLHSKYMKFIPDPTTVINQKKKMLASMRAPSSSASFSIAGTNTPEQKYQKIQQQRIRTFALLLLQQYGKIYKSQYIDACTNVSSLSSTNAVNHTKTLSECNMIVCKTILHQIAKPTKDGYWVCKIMDDVPFQLLHPKTKVKHDTYWNQKQRVRFEKELQYYETVTLK
jgi:RPC5 protein